MKFKIFSAAIFLILAGIAGFFIFNSPKNNKQNKLPAGQTLFFEDFELGNRLSDGWNSFLVHEPTAAELSDCPDYPNGPPQKYILCSHAFDLVTDPVASGKYALKVTVNPGDTAVAGDAKKAKDRAELQRKDFGTEGRNGTELWYEWSFMIPKDYKYNPQSDTLQIMGQLHVYDKGADTNPPPVSVNYGINDGKSGIYISYGLKDINKRKVAESFITLGEWVDIALHVKWSTRNDGFVEAYINGKPITPFNGKDNKFYGPNLYNKDVVAFFKIGLYRGHGVTTTNSVYFDNVKIVGL